MSEGPHRVAKIYPLVYYVNDIPNNYRKERIMSLRQTFNSMSPAAIYAAIEDYVDTDEKDIYNAFHIQAEKLSGRKLEENAFKEGLFGYFSELVCEKDKLGKLLSEISDQELRGLAAKISGARKEGGVPDDDVMAFLDTADTALINCDIAIRNEVFFRFMTKKEA